MKLKPCPLCGQPAVPTAEKNCRCSNPKCSLFRVVTPAEDWNNRPAEDKLRRKVRRLARLNTELHMSLALARAGNWAWTCRPLTTCPHANIICDTAGMRCADCGHVFSPINITTISETDETGD